jgi:hypothetical protein
LTIIKIIQENSIENNELTISQNNKIMMPEANEKHLSMFSWRTANEKPVNGSGRKLISSFEGRKIY